MVVRLDFCFVVISLCHVFGSYYFASVFLLRYYEPFVNISCCTHLTYLDVGW